MVYEYQFPLNHYDSASLFLIKKTWSKKNYHLTDPAYISPHYKESPVIFVSLGPFYLQIQTYRFWKHKDQNR